MCIYDIYHGYLTVLNTIHDRYGSTLLCLDGITIIKDWLMKGRLNGSRLDWSLLKRKVVYLVWYYKGRILVMTVNSRFKCIPTKWWTKTKIKTGDGLKNMKYEDVLVTIRYGNWTVYCLSPLHLFPTSFLFELSVQLSHRFTIIGLISHL